MDVEDIEEDADPQQLGAPQTKFLRGRGAHDHLDPPIRRADHETGPDRGDTIRIAEEIRDPGRDACKDPADRCIGPEPDQGGSGGQNDERPARAMDGGKGLHDRVEHGTAGSGRGRFRPDA